MTQSPCRAPATPTPGGSPSWLRRWWPLLLWAALLWAALLVPALANYGIGSTPAVAGVQKALAGRVPFPPSIGLVATRR